MTKDGLSRVRVRPTALALTVVLCAGLAVYGAAPSAGAAAQVTKTISITAVTTKGYDMTFVASKTGHSAALGVVFERKNDTNNAIAIDIYDVPLKGSDVTIDRSLRSGHLNMGAELGPLGRINMTFGHAGTLKRQTSCSKKLAIRQRPGKLRGSFTFKPDDPGVDALGTIRYATLSAFATRTADSGCTETIPPNCPASRVSFSDVASTNDAAQTLGVVAQQDAAPDSSIGAVLVELDRSPSLEIHLLAATSTDPTDFAYDPTLQSAHLNPAADPFITGGPLDYTSSTTSSPASSGCGGSPETISSTSGSVAGQATVDFGPGGKRDIPDGSEGAMQRIATGAPPVPALTPADRAALEQAPPIVLKMLDRFGISL